MSSDCINMVLGSWIVIAKYILYRFRNGFMENVNCEASEGRGASGDSTVEMIRDRPAIEPCIV